MPRWLAIAVVLVAQSTPAPVDFSGRWNLDTYLSDHPEQVAAAIRTDLHLSGETTFVLAGGRGRQSRRGNEQRSSSKPPSADEQERIDDLTLALRYPAPTLTITQHGDTVTLADPQGQTRTLAHWEGPQLVSTTDLGHGRRLVATLSMVPTTRQLMIRTVVERAPNEPGPFEIKQVYDRAER